MAGVSRGRSILKGDGRPEKAREARAAGGGGGPHETMRWGQIAQTQQGLSGFELHSDTGKALPCVALEPKF